MSIHSISKILLATDFSEVSEEATNQAVALAKALNAKLGIVHVFDSGMFQAPTAPYFLPVGGAVALDQLENVRQKGHEALAARAERFDIPVESMFVEGRTGQEIVNTAESWDADLVVLGSHGYTGLSRVVLGSVAEYVVRHASCAVLTVKPQGAPEVVGALSQTPA